jgi:Secretion system C-terminal sorting domain/Kelch motif
MKKKLLITLYVLAATTINAQWKSDTLSVARNAIPMGVFANKIVFGSSSGNAWDVFDLNTNSHSTGIFSISRASIKFTQAGHNAYFAGGKYGPYTDPLYTKNIDVYNDSLNTWSVLNLSLDRIVGGAGTVGTNVLFAGGIGRGFGGPVYIYNRVDIFNTNTGVRTTASLSKARDNIAVGTAANKIVFAGGWFWDIYYNMVQTNAIDIYDNATGLWSNASLSAKREGIAVATLGNKILFAGGTAYTNTTKIYTNVDIFDAVANTWTVSYMPNARSFATAVTVGSKAYFAGGAKKVNAIDVYDAGMNSWSQIFMPVALTGFSATAAGDKIYFAGGYDRRNFISGLVQVYNTVTGTWAIEQLSQPRYGVSAVAKGSTIFFAGGIKAPYSPITYSNMIDIFQPLPMAVKANASQALQNETFGIYPNPAKDLVYIKTGNTLLQNATIKIVNSAGQTVLYKSQTGNLLDISALQNGLYLMQIIYNGKTASAKLLIAH